MGGDGRELFRRSHRLHAIEFLEKIVRELDVGLIDLVDQKNRPFVRDEGLPEFAALDVVPNILDARITQLAVAQPGHRIVFVETLQRLGCRLDVPLDQGGGEGLGDFERQDGLARTGLALDERRALQGNRGMTATFRSSVAT